MLRRHAIWALALALTLRADSAITSQASSCDVDLAAGTRTCDSGSGLVASVDSARKSALVASTRELSASEATHVHARVCAPYSRTAETLALYSLFSGPILSLNGSDLHLFNRILPNWLLIAPFPPDGRCARVSALVSSHQICAFHSLDSVQSKRCVSLPSNRSSHAEHLLINRESTATKSASVEIANLSTPCRKRTTVSSDEGDSLCLCKAGWAGAKCDRPAPTSCLVDVDTAKVECVLSSSMIAEQLNAQPSNTGGSGSGSAVAALHIGNHHTLSARVDVTVCGPVGETAIEVGNRGAGGLPLLRVSNSSLKIVGSSSTVGAHIEKKRWLPQLSPGSCTTVHVQRDPDGSVTAWHGFDPKSSIATFTGLLGSSAHTIGIGLNQELSAVTQAEGVMTELEGRGVTKALLSLVPFSTSDEEADNLCSRYCSKHGKCTGDCSPKGKCISSTCVCEPGWFGPHCDQPVVLRCSMRLQNRKDSESDCLSNKGAAISVGTGKESLFREGAEVEAAFKLGTEFGLSAELYGLEEKLKGRWLTLEQKESESRLYSSGRSIEIGLRKAVLQSSGELIQAGASPSSLFPLDFLVRNGSVYARTNDEEIAARDHALYSASGNLRVIMGRGTRNEQASGALKQASLELAGNDDSVAADGACAGGCSSRGECVASSDGPKCNCPIGWSGVVCDVQTHTTCKLDCFEGRSRGCSVHPFNLEQTPSRQESARTIPSEAAVFVNASNHSTVVAHARVCWGVHQSAKLLRVTDGDTSAVLTGSGVLHIDVPNEESLSGSKREMTGLIPAVEKRPGNTKCVTASVAVARDSVAAWNSQNPRKSFKAFEASHLFKRIGRPEGSSVLLSVNDKQPSSWNKTRKQELGGVVELIAASVGGQHANGNAPSCSTSGCAGRSMCFLGECYCSDLRKGRQCRERSKPRDAPHGNSGRKTETLQAIGYAVLTLTVLAVLGLVMLLVLNRLGIVELRLEERLEALKERLFGSRDREEQDYISLLSSDREGSYIPSSRFE